MNPLLTLWLMILSLSIILSGVFWLAENHSDIFGNFYFLTGTFFGGYGLYFLITWLRKRNRKKPAA